MDFVNRNRHERAIVGREILKVWRWFCVVCVFRLSERKRRSVALVLARLASTGDR